MISYIELIRLSDFDKDYDSVKVQMWGVNGTVVTEENAVFQAKAFLSNRSIGKIEIKLLSNFEPVGTICHPELILRNKNDSYEKEKQLEVAYNILNRNVTLSKSKWKRYYV